MKKTLLLSFLLLALLHLFAQKQKGFFEIANKKIFFEMVEKIAVQRTVRDTILHCKGTALKNYSLGTNTSYVEIPLRDFKTLYREIFNEKSCIWTRITNDVVMKERKDPVTDINLLNDSTFLCHIPPPCYRHDTVMQINPVTLEEQQVVSIDSTLSIKFNLGNISKAELTQAVSNQFGLSMNGANLRLKNILLVIFNDKCDGLEIDYSKPEQIALANKKIQNIPPGSDVIISLLYFEDTNGRKFTSSLYDVAVMKIKE